MDEPRIVLVGRMGTSTNVLYHALASRFPVSVVHEIPPPLHKLLRWRAARVGWTRVLGQLLFQVAVAVPMGRLSASRRREILADAGLSAEAPPAHALAVTQSVNSNELLGQVHQLHAALVVINGTRILSQRTLDAMGLPILNVHAGITPKYRGVHGAYWALVNKDPENCGVTVHLVDKGVDTGGILCQGLISPSDHDNFSTYPILQLALGSKLLVQAVADVLAGNRSLLAGPAESRRWYHPTLWQYLYYRLARGIR